MRLIVIMTSVALVSCGGNGDDGSAVNEEYGAQTTTVSSENMDRDELSEELVSALIRENLPAFECSYFTVNQFYNYEQEGGGDTLPGTLRFQTGIDALPRNMVFGASQRGNWDFNGLEPLINAGLLTATPVRVYTMDVAGPFQGTLQQTNHVYRIDFSDEVKQSQTFKINVGGSLTTASGVLLGYCPSNISISNVQYVMPNGGNVTSATFIWDVGGEDPLAERLRGIQNPHTLGLPTLPSPNGTGTASFMLTNNGWSASRVSFD